MKKTIFLLAGLAFLTSKTQSQTVTDYDGNVYHTLEIGTQVWLQENLKVTHYNDGSPISNVAGTATWATLTTGARCYYNNDSAANDSVYGPLYNWYAVSDARKLCPSGWHVSSNAEWLEAETSLGGASVAGGEMKETGTLHWASPNTGATNSTGFTGLPGGMRDPVNNNFRTVLENGLWWTASQYNSSMAWSTYMWYMYAGVDHNPGTKKYGFNVRCVKDITTGLEKNDYPEKMIIYPNPSKGKITIGYADNQYKSVLVYNIFGELVMQSKLTLDKTDLDLSTLPKGIYLLKMKGERSIMQKEIVRE